MNIEAITSVAAALSDPTRLRLLAAVIAPGGEREDVCVCELTTLVDLAPSTVSKHLSILRDAGLIEGRKQGRWMYYRAATEAQGLAGDALRVVRDARGRDKVLVQDGARLRGIVAAAAEACCTVEGRSGQVDERKD